jgi:hypothetical protein
VAPTLAIRHESENVKIERFANSRNQAAAPAVIESHFNATRFWLPLKKAKSMETAGSG